jgi:enediyne biosynthesis protein E4
MSTRCLIPVLLLSAGARLAAAQSLGYDLLEVNASPGPLNPGVAHTFVPVTDAPSEATGASVADVNNDGFEDLFLCNTEGFPDLLYINNGDGTFTESAAAYGVQETAKRRGNSLFFDLDNDGDLDLITFGYPGDTGSVINLDLFSLFRNDGAPSYHFTDITASSGGFVLGPTTDDNTLGIPGGAAVGDYDRDGFLDVVVTYWNDNTHEGTFGHDQLRLWHNVPNPNPPGPGQLDYTPRLLVDATLGAGLDSIGEAQSWMPTFLDFDRDGWPDLHLCVDGGPDHLRMNNKNGTFGPNIATTVGLNYNAAGAAGYGNEMGVALGDYDNDGDLDIYLTNLGIAAITNKADAFYRNDSNLAIGGTGLKYTYIGGLIGIKTTLQQGFGWGTSFADLDNDGDEDLLTARGSGTNLEQNWVERNLYPTKTSDGKSVTIENVSASLPSFSGLGTALTNSRALVCFDYDNDGDVDVVCTRSAQTNPPPVGNLNTSVFLNTLSTDKVALEVDLVNSGGSLNTVGAREFVRTGGVTGTVQMAEVFAGTSYLSQEPARLHFGLAHVPGADWLAIRWFDGTQQVVRGDSGPPMVGLRTVVHAAHDDTGDLDGDGDTDATDLALFITGLANPAAVDAVSPNWPWKQMADADGNGLRDKRDFALLRTKVGGPFADLGNGLAGFSGVPVLTGSGPLTASSPVTLTISNARPSTNWWLIVGFDLLVKNFKGGLLVPSVNLIVGPLPTLGGTLPLSDTWPALPPGLQIFFQAWVQDSAGPSGFAASNALGALTP